MQSDGLRNRKDAPVVSNAPDRDSDTDLAIEESDSSLQPPRFTINLSLPPFGRYHKLARAFKTRIQGLPVLFDEVVQEIHLPPTWARKIARLCLRKVYSTEETEELRGICKITGLEMYLLVAYNVLLDLFMGCTSGGARVQDSGSMLHFRTLDWGMDVLRKVVVQLDFVKKSHGPVIASSITYAGYVGVLTGVRKGLSLSLNFRPCHDSSTRLANFKYYLNHLLVLLGFRPSISSLLRQCLLPAPAFQPRYAPGSNLGAIEQRFPHLVTTAVYVIVSDGNKTVLFEKDRVNAMIVPSDEFVVATNHDTKEEFLRQESSTTSNVNTAAIQMTGMEGLVEESIYRKQIVCDLWRKTLQRRGRGNSRRPAEHKMYVWKADIIKWLNTYPITNEETHYATIMDPQAGHFIWTHRYVVSPFDEDKGQS